MNRLFATASIVLLAVAALAADEPIRCARTRINVPGWSANERDLVCGASEAAIVFLSANGVSYHGEDLTIRPLLVRADDEPECLIGVYDARRNEIFVLTYDASIGASRKLPRAFDMPMSPPLWQSFISHETAHAVAEQNFVVGAPHPASSEYIAAVVQMATLPAELRNAILDRYSAQGFGAGEISTLLYEFNPAVFTVMAYRHYVALGDSGPAFLKNLLHEGIDQ